MTPRDVLLEAARRIAEGKTPYCCTAINMSYCNKLETKDAARSWFTTLFYPTGAEATGALFWDKPQTVARQEQRVLCLLFAAWSIE